MGWRSRGRTDRPELMDAPDCDPGELREALEFLRRLNRVSLACWILARAVRSVNRGPAGRVLDVATGGADVPAHFLRVGAAGLAVGLDRGLRTLAAARDLSPDVPLVRADALRLPFADRSFDVVTCHLFFHHLAPPECGDLLREMARVGRSVVVMDLVRSRGLHALIRLLTRFLGNRLTRHDGPVSVRRAYTVEEVREIAAAAGVPLRVRGVPFWRWAAVLSP